MSRPQEDKLDWSTDIPVSVYVTHPRRIRIYVLRPLVISVYVLRPLVISDFDERAFKTIAPQSMRSKLGLTGVCVLLPPEITDFDELAFKTVALQSKPSKLRLISGVYASDPRNKGIQVLEIEHSALQELGNQWNLEVKCRPKVVKASAGRWTNVWDIYPDATVKVKHNYIELTIPSEEEVQEFALFGIPEMNDTKRMRMGVFGGKATRGKDWRIFVTLFDDTIMAFEHLCEKEESEGRQLLTTFPGLFVSNSDEDIKIDISALGDGWKIIGSNVMTIKSKDAWNSPENSTDFPCCVFEIAHVDETKQSFSCGITASHLNDTAETELVAFFEQENEVSPVDQDFIDSPELPIQEHNVFEVFVFIQMLAFFFGCFTGSRFDPHAPKEGSAAVQLESYNGK